MEETFSLSIDFEPGYEMEDFYTDRAISCQILPKNGPYEVVKIKYYTQDGRTVIDVFKFRDVRRINSWEPRNQNKAVDEAKSQQSI